MKDPNHGIEENVFRLKEVKDSDPIEKLNKTYAVVLFGNKAAVMRQDIDIDGTPVLQFMAVKDFSLWLGNRFINTGTKDEPKWVALAKHWLQHQQRRQYKSVVFRPGIKLPDEHFNLWTGWGVVPNPGGSCAKFLAHLQDNVCRGNDEHYNWLFGFFADIFKNPCDKKDTSAVLRGDFGTGKTIVGKTFGRLLGSHYVPVSEPRFITGRFNSHMLSCLLLVADEAFFGDTKAEGKLRDLVSGTRHMIELKGYEPYLIDNHLRLLVIGDKAWIVPAGLRERRFAVFDVGDDHIQDNLYFAAIEAELRNGGYEALLYRLLNCDLNTVDLRKIPNTAALVEQKFASLDINTRWWADVLKRGELPRLSMSYKNCCPKASLHESYLVHTDRIGRSDRSTETELGRFLRKMLPGIGGMPGLSSIRPRIVSTTTTTAGTRMYQFPSLSECRDAFAKMTRAETMIAWDEQEDWEHEVESS
jgi:hypothetical protein